MTDSKALSKKNTLTKIYARILALLSAFVYVIPGIAGIHRLYLGQHLLYIIYLSLSIISVIGYGFKAYDIHRITGILVGVMSFIDVLFMPVPGTASAPTERKGDIQKVKPYMNNRGEYPINNDSFIYTLLGLLTLLTVICFWFSGKIVCHESISDYLEYADKCIWLTEGNKNSVLESINSGFGIFTGGEYLRLETFPAVVFENKLTGFSLIFIEAIILAWYLNSKFHLLSGSQATANNANDPTAALAKLKNLYDTGVITEEEYNQKRQKYLDQL